MDKEKKELTHLQGCAVIFFVFIVATVIGALMSYDEGGVRQSAGARMRELREMDISSMTTEEIVQEARTKEEFELMMDLFEIEQRHRK